MLKAQVNKYEKEEVKKSKVRQEKEIHNNREFPCEVCPKKYESSVKLNVHVKLDHCKANSSQTDDILLETKSAQTRKEILIEKTVQTQTNAADVDKIIEMSKEYEKYSTVKKRSEVRYIY